MICASSFLNLLASFTCCFDDRHIHLFCLFTLMKSINIQFLFPEKKSPRMNELYVETMVGKSLSSWLISKPSTDQVWDQQIVSLVKQMNEGKNFTFSFQSYSLNSFFTIAENPIILHLKGLFVISFLYLFAWPVGHQKMTPLFMPTSTPCCVQSW